MTTAETLQAKASLPGIHTVTPAELYELLSENRVNLIDVREPGEFFRERIPGAQSLPLSRFKVESLPQNADKTLVLSCLSANRSGEAARLCLDHGFSQVFHLEGGLANWKQAGYDTHFNPKAPISIMRQVQIIAGSLVLAGTLLGAFVAPGFLFLSGFVGAGLTFAGLSGTCMMARVLGKLPYNQRSK